MDTLLLSRLQFAVATYFHFLFVPLTLGLSILTALMETKYAKTGDEDYLKATKFWGKLFLINFALGVVTGITLEFQFGTNWSRYSAYVGDIFGSLLAIEATVAFFLESTFIGVWIFGWKKMSAKAHAGAMWAVAAATNVSAFWILIANSWMQHPVGYVLRNGRAELDDFLAVITQPFAWNTIIHQLSAAYLVAGFFVLGISAWHLARKSHVDVFKKSFRTAAGWTLTFALVAVAHGHMMGAEVAKTQPTKLAAMESHWDTQKAAPIYLFAIPDEENERNLIEILPMPAALSMLAFHSPTAEVKGLKEWPKEERPPVLLSFVSFRTMVGLGMLFLLTGLIVFIYRDHPGSKPWMLKILPFMIPLPYIANELGWTLTEVGRQPWIVYGLMKTADAVSPVSPGQVWISLVAFIAVYGLLGAVDVFLLFKYARKGPEPVREG